MNNFSSQALPAGAMALVRILILMIGPYAIGQGWVQADDLEGIVTAIVTIAVAMYGLYKTFKRQQKLNTAENILGQPIPEQKK